MTVHDPLRILVADDTPDMRDLLRLTLEQQHFRVVAEAADGVEAIDQAGMARPDAVLLDLSMPRMDGLEAIPQILLASPETKIVVLSGFESSLIVNEALGRGAHAYVPKGTSAKAIAAKLREVCGAGAPSPSVPPEPAPAGEDSSNTLSALVHELRNQATVVEGFTEMLLQNWEALSNEQRRGYFERVARNAAQMRALLEILTDVNRIGAGGFQLAFQPVALSAVVRETVDDMALSVNRPIDLEIKEEATVRADPIRVRQVLTNLLSNAVKFSPPDTPISVFVRRVGSSAEMRVEDSCSGIPPERRGELFRPFARLGATQPGTGLGLFISREIVQAHGGMLFHVDTDGGCSFVVQLPAV